MLNTRHFVGGQIEVKTSRWHSCSKSLLSLVLYEPLVDVGVHLGISLSENVHFGR